MKQSQKNLLFFSLGIIFTVVLMMCGQRLERAFPSLRNFAQQVQLPEVP